MNFVKIAKTSEFENNDFKKVSMMGKKVALFKCDEEDAGYFAVEVTCNHQGADLTTGKRNGYVFTCPRHGWIYDMKTGECKNADSPRLRRHAIEIEGDEIRVSLFPVGS